MPMPMPILVLPRSSCDATASSSAPHPHQSIFAAWTMRSCCCRVLMRIPNRLFGHRPLRSLSAPAAPVLRLLDKHQHQLHWQRPRPRHRSWIQVSAAALPPSSRRRRPWSAPQGRYRLPPPPPSPHRCRCRRCSAPSPPRTAQGRHAPSLARPKTAPKNCTNHSHVGIGAQINIPAWVLGMRSCANCEFRGRAGGTRPSFIVHAANKDCHQA